MLRSKWWRFSQAAVRAWLARASSQEKGRIARSRPYRARLGLRAVACSSYESSSRAAACGSAWCASRWSLSPSPRGSGAPWRTGGAMSSGGRSLEPCSRRKLTTAPFRKCAVSFRIPRSTSVAASARPQTGFTARPKTPRPRPRKTPAAPALSAPRIGSCTKPVTPSTTPPTAESKPSANPSIKRVRRALATSREARASSFARCRARYSASSAR
mmetsp:Transcript_2854/g.10268  ORF Transcript_2854/g.10268 Transcript_2854/m.10268 type:complete len:214 (+) Transcript_2854:327-968(+)